MKVVTIKDFYLPEDRKTIERDIISNYVPGQAISPIVKTTTDFFDNLYDRFIQKCYEIFGDITVREDNNPTCWCYVGTHENYIRFYHDHTLTSTINGVFYYQVNEGDGITFLERGREKVFNPDENELLIFPNNLLHTPNRPVKLEYNRRRYAFNLEVLTEETSEELFLRI